MPKLRYAPRNVHSSKPHSTFLPLTNIEIFHEMPIDEISNLSKQCQCHLYSSNQQIIKQGDQVRSIFFIASGKVRIRAYSQSGKQVSFFDLKEGQLFGELAALDGYPYFADVVALSECLIYKIDIDIFWAVLERYPIVAAATLRWMAGLMRALFNRVFELSTLTVRDRIHTELLRLSNGKLSNSGKVVIYPAPTHADIANKINTHREAVTKELSKLSHDGLINRQGKSLIICDIEYFTEYARNIGIECQVEHK